MVFETNGFISMSSGKKGGGGSSLSVGGQGAKDKIELSILVSQVESALVGDVVLQGFFSDFFPPGVQKK
jgi:hypothetical protein